MRSLWSPGGGETRVPALWNSDAVGGEEHIHAAWSVTETSLWYTFPFIASALYDFRGRKASQLSVA